MPPPIVLFLFDQLRADALGAAGQPFARTPSLDRLAASSVRFETCVTNAPLCRPARVTLLGGRWVHEHGIDTNRRAPPPSIESHVRALRDEAGHHTAVVGKTHLHDGGGHLDQHRAVLERFGFAEAHELPDAERHDVESGHSDWLRATTADGHPDKHRRWRDYVAHHRFGAPPPDRAPWALGIEDHLDVHCARSAAALVRGYGGDRPLYLSVCFPGPHPPFDAPSAFLDAFDPADPRLPLPIPASSTGPASPIARRYLRRSRAWTEADARRLRAAYFAKVALVDQAFGRVIAALEDAGLLDEAWILVTADHGELLADHGFTGKVLPYEGAVRVPLLVRPPGGVEGWTDRGAVDLRDVVATIRAIAGLAPGAGRSLVARALEGPTGPEAHRDHDVVFECLGTVAVRTADATLAWDRRVGPVALYDRRSDPEERHNAIEDPSSRPTIEALVERLRAAGAIEGRA